MLINFYNLNNLSKFTGLIKKAFFALLKDEKAPVVPP